MGSSDQQFCLRWNNHQTNLLSVFDQLLQNESFVDVTLACDGLSLKAHKVVLSACSPYFQSLLLENPCQHPIVILKDVGYPDLKALVDFMYKGEVNVSQEQLTALLKTAEMLKVKGLSEVSPNRPLSPHRKDGGQVRVTVSASSSGSPVRCEASGTPRPPNAISPQIQSQTQISSGQSPFGRLSASPPSKRKKGWPRRRSGGGSSSGPSDVEDNGGVALDSSPEVVETKVERTRMRNDGQSSSTMADHRQTSEVHSGPALVHSSTATGQVEEKHQQCLESSNVLAMPGFTPIMSQGPTQQQQQQQHQYQPPPTAAVSTHTPPVNDVPDEEQQQHHQQPQDHAPSMRFDGLSSEEDYDERRGPGTNGSGGVVVGSPALGTGPGSGQVPSSSASGSGPGPLGPQWSSDAMNQALDAVRAGRVSLSRASALYAIPSTTLWQRAKREGIDTAKREAAVGTSWTEEDLAQALEAASAAFKIPNTTLWQRSRKEGIDTSRNNILYSHQSNWTEMDLAQALEAVRTGRMSVNKASATYGIPSTTLWSKAKRHGIDTARRNIFDQDRDEQMGQALQAIKTGLISMTQASIKYNVPYTTLWKHFKKWEMASAHSVQHGGGPVPIPLPMPMSMSHGSMNFPPPPPPMHSAPHHHHHHHHHPAAMEGIAIGPMDSILPEEAAWSRRRRSPVLDGPLRCGICAKVISSACNFRKHMEVHNPVRQFYPCPLCQRGYNRKDNLSWHLKHKHGVPTTQRRLQARTSSASLADDDEDEGPGPGAGHHGGDYS